MKKKGLRSIEARLERDWRQTFAELEQEGYICLDGDENLSDNFCELSGRCITPVTALNTECDWLADNGVDCDISFYDLFSFNEDEDGMYVDFESIECYDFQEFANELNQYLKDNGLIMQTWKYKKSKIAKAPKLVYANYDRGFTIYKPYKVNVKALQKHTANIKQLCLEHLTWEMTSDALKEKKRLEAQLAEIELAEREERAREEYKEKVLNAEIPQKYFDLVDSIPHFQTGSYERFHANLGDFQRRAIAYEAMVNGCNDCVDVVMMLEQ